uniref:Uncharacterized protein n=1 Tax=Rhizophora mucronata TaxID=61149 RepID=A0A2P2Q5W4_RHIMU
MPYVQGSYGTPREQLQQYSNLIKMFEAF